MHRLLLARPRLEKLLRHGVVPLFALLAACGGNSCSSCMGPIPGGFPTDNQRHENSVQVRVSQGALDFINDHGDQLFASLLPGGGQSFDIPASCSGDQQICCPNGTPGTCAIDIDLQHVGLSPNPPSNLALSVLTHLQTEAPLPVKITQKLGPVPVTADCLISVDTHVGGASGITLVGNLNFTVDPETDLTRISLKDVDIQGLSDNMLDIKSAGGLNGALCTVGNLGFVKNLLIGQLTGQLTGPITSALDDALCAQCTTQGDCDSFADTCSDKGQCMRKNQCLQEVGVAGRLDLASLSSLFASTGGKLDILAMLGGYADVLPAGVGSGLSLGMLGGGRSAAHNPCVPMRPAPEVAPIAKWAAYSQNTEPGGQGFHVGIGVHRSYLDTLAWAAFDSGALCLNVGTSTVAQLDSATLGIILPSLSDLTHGVDVPMVLALRPNQEPHVTFGAGTDADPLLHVAIPQLSIDFYAFIEERYVRVMTLTADVELGVQLTVDDQGQLVPSIGDLNNAFKNVVVTNSELLAESPQKLASAFPTLLSAAGGALGSLSPIALPDLMGIKLSVVGIEATDNNDFLSIFANLDVASPDAFHASTEAELRQVEAPPTEVFAAPEGLDPAKQPRVRLALGGAGHAGDASDLEWSARLDDGTWSTYSSDAEPAVSGPELWLQGRHHVEVRARVVGEPRTTDPEPVRIDFLVDTVAPKGWFDVAGGELTMDASDLVSAVDQLEFSVKAPGGEWSEWSHERRLTVPALGDDAGWLARVRDEAGNVGSLAFHGRTTTPSSGGGCSCAVGAGGADSGTAVFGAALLALLGLWLRFGQGWLARRGVTAVLALAGLGGLVVGAAGCGKHASSLDPSAQLDPIDEIGRYSDAKAANGVLYVSAYDDSYGDLAYAEIDLAKLGPDGIGQTAPVDGGVGQGIVWQWVDGVPVAEPDPDAKPVPKAQQTYRDNGNPDPGDDVGLYTSLALGDDGLPRIAYYDATHGALKFAVGDSARRFTVSFVDQPDDMADAANAHVDIGRYASLSLDAMNVPSVAYVVRNVFDKTTSGYVAKLRIATATSAQPAGPKDWSYVDVDQTAIPCAGLCNKGSACISTDDADPSKSVCKLTATTCGSSCKKDTQACIEGACVDVLVPAKAQDLIEGTGLFANLLRLPNGRAIVYHDRSQGDLKLALEGPPGTFTVSFLDGNDPATDVGQFATAAVAADGTISVAYVDAIGDRLLYKTAKAGMVAATPEIIDDGLRSDGPHPVGSGAALSVAGGVVRVAYQDQRLADLLIATRSGTQWMHTAPMSDAGPAGYGFYPRLVADEAGALYLTQFVYDRGAPDGTPFGSLRVQPIATK